MSHTTTKIIIAQEDGTVVGQYFLGLGEHVIGCSIESSVCISDVNISPQHALLIISEDIIEVEDLGSTSGTYLDGITVKGRIPIQPGQNLWVSNLYIDIERQGFGGLVEGSRLGEGRFTLKRELGRGGMGAVWLALDEEARENVALKLVSDGMRMDPKGLNELEREVNKASKLVHPNIVRVGYFWKQAGEPAFICLEYVEGTNLHQLRSKSPKGLLAWSEVQAYMLQLCDALEYAHSQNVAHRDIKPDNFLIDLHGNLKLADFGIAASLANTSSTFTSTTVLGLGTPPYMSPQQLDGKRPNVTDDIYSVGATFYDLLTSSPPFHQGDIDYQVRHSPATPMEERLKELNLENDIPHYVGAIVMACLHKDPAKRPPSAKVIRDWIEASDTSLVEKEQGVSKNQSDENTAGPPEAAAKQTTWVADLAESVPESWQNVAHQTKKERHQQEEVKLQEEKQAIETNVNILEPSITLCGHESAVLCLDWSPDGKRIVSSGSDGTTRIWDVSIGQVMQVLHGHRNKVHSVAWSPDGSHIATGGVDRTVRVWDSKSGQQLHAHNSNLDYVRQVYVKSVVWSSDGRNIISGWADGTVKIWDALSGKIDDTFEGHSGSVEIVACSPDGKLIASGGQDKIVKVWNLLDGKEWHSLKGHTGSVNSLQWSPDGEQIISGSSDKSVRIWDASKGYAIRTLRGQASSVDSLAISPKGGLIAVGSNDGVIPIRDLHSGHVLYSLAGHLGDMGDISDVSWCLDGKRIASCGGYESINVWAVPE